MVKKIPQAVVIRSIRKTTDPDWLHSLLNHHDPVIVYHVSRNPAARPDSLAKAASIIKSAPLGWSSYIGDRRMYHKDDLASVRFCPKGCDMNELKSQLGTVSDNLVHLNDGSHGIASIQFFNLDDANEVAKRIAKLAPEACPTCRKDFALRHNVALASARFNSLDDIDHEDEDTGTLQWFDTKHYNSDGSLL